MLTAIWWIAIGFFVLLGFAFIKINSSLDRIITTLEKIKTRSVTPLGKRDEYISELVSRGASHEQCVHYLTTYDRENSNSEKS